MDGEERRTRRAERRLLAGLRAGDENAWAQLCETYADDLFRYAYHRCRDRLVAEDVRQETLLTAADRIGDYRGEAPLFGWLAGIARHKLVDESRRSARVLPAEDAGLALADADPDPPEVAERAERLAAVVEALGTLPGDYREALVARYVRGDGVPEVADHLGRSYKATESVLSRAREALRRRMLEVYGE